MIAWYSSGKYEDRLYAEDYDVFEKSGTTCRQPEHGYWGRTCRLCSMEAVPPNCSASWTTTS